MDPKKDMMQHPWDLSCPYCMEDETKDMMDRSRFNPKTNHERRGYTMKPAPASMQSTKALDDLAERDRLDKLERKFNNGI